MPDNKKSIRQRPRTYVNPADISHVMQSVGISKELATGALRKHDNNVAVTIHKVREEMKTHKKQRAKKGEGGEKPNENHEKKGKVMQGGVSAGNLAFIEIDQQKNSSSKHPIKNKPANHHQNKTSDISSQVRDFLAQKKLQQLKQQ